MSSSNNYLTKIAIVGASGNVGASTVKHLLASNDRIHITIISRSDSTATFPSSPQITVKKGSYDDDAFLKDAFSGNELAMFTLAFAPNADALQKRLIEAAAAAGVEWIVPNEYAGDGTHPKMSTEVPLFAPKTAAREHITKLAKGKYPELKYIAIATNPWTEMSLTRGLFGIDIANRTYTRLLSTGKFNTSSQERVGEGIAKLLSLPLKNSAEPRKILSHYANSYAYISSFAATQEEIFEATKRATGTKDEDWKIVEEDNNERIRGLREKFEKEGDFWAGAGLTYCYYLGEGLGGDWGKKGEEEREVLGLETEDLDTVVKRALEG